MHCCDALLYGPPFCIGFSRSKRCTQYIVHASTCHTLAFCTSMTACNSDAR